MICTIKRIYKSSISEIENMYIDALDYQGIIFWYKDALKYIEEINNSNTGMI